MGGGCVCCGRWNIRLLKIQIPKWIDETLNVKESALFGLVGSGGQVEVEEKKEPLWTQARQPLG